MKTKIFIMLLVISLFAISCKKKTYVTIQAKHLVTGEGTHYAGMKYTVSAEKDVSFNKTKSKLLHSGELDENGHASFELKMPRFQSRYLVSVKQPDNICYGGLSFERIYIKNKNNNLEFQYLPCGYANINSDNINCEGETDEFRFKYYYTQNPDIYIYTGFGNMIQWNYNFIAGCVSHYGNDSFSVPEGNYTIEWEVRRPSGITTGIDTFTVYENDTTTYLIQY